MIIPNVVRLRFSVTTEKADFAEHWRSSSFSFVSPERRWRIFDARREYQF